MRQEEWLAEQFEEQRPHLRAVAYRMLGSLSEADDAVQDAWLPLSRADTSEVENAEGLAFVLHDMLAGPFDEIAAIVERPRDGQSSRRTQAAFHPPR